jgi:hypothetical protein
MKSLNLYNNFKVKRTQETKYGTTLDTTIFRITIREVSNLDPKLAWLPLVTKRILKYYDYAQLTRFLTSPLLCNSQLFTCFLKLKISFNFSLLNLKHQHRCPMISMTTFSIKGLYVPFIIMIMKITDTEHNNALLSVIMLIVTFYLLLCWVS